MTAIKARWTRKRVLTAAAAALAGTAAAAGCGPVQRTTPGDSPPRRQPATIEWYKYLNAAQVQQAPQFLAEFQAEHAQTTVKPNIRPGGMVQYMPQLVAMLAGGQPPDVLQIHGTAYLAVVLDLA